MITTRSKDRAELTIEVTRSRAKRIGQRITGGMKEIGYNTSSGYAIEVQSKRNLNEQKQTELRSRA